MKVLFHLSESLVEPFSVETSTRPMTDASSLISVNPTSSPSCTHAAAILEASPPLNQSSSSQASGVEVSVTATASSTQPPAFMQLSGPQQISDVPQASVQASNHVGPQHYVALPPTFLQPESATQTTPLQSPISAPLTTASSSPATAAVVASGVTDSLAAVAQPVPLANSPVPNSATITIAPTQNILQPGLVMSDQNLQWILSSAANSQQNPEQAVSNAPLQYLHDKLG